MICFCSKSGSCSQQKNLSFCWKLLSCVAICVVQIYLVVGGRSSGATKNNNYRTQSEQKKIKQHRRGISKRMHKPTQVSVLMVMAGVPLVHAFAKVSTVLKACDGRTARNFSAAYKFSHCRFTCWISPSQLYTFSRCSSYFGKDNIFDWRL